MAPEGFEAGADPLRTRKLRDDRGTAPSDRTYSTPTTIRAMSFLDLLILNVGTRFTKLPDSDLAPLSRLSRA